MFSYYLTLYFLFFEKIFTYFTGLREQIVKHVSKIIVLLAVLTVVNTSIVQASHISGIRITQTGNTGLMVNVDVTAFYSTGSTESTANLGTYYNQVPAIDWGDGETVPRYGYGASTGIPLVATSTVVNGIPARAYRGSFSHTYGSAGNYTIAANTGCCPQTTPTYTLVSGTLLETTVMTTGPFGPTTFNTSFVQNTLSVGAVAPVFSKVFAPDNTAVGAPSTLTFTIDNTASSLADNNLDFTDNLPAGLVIATPANVVNTCTGGTITATPDTADISYTGGEVAAGASCTLSVDTVAVVPGNYDNVSGELTSGFGNSGTASDTLTVTAVTPGIAKTFSPLNTGVGSPSTLTLIINNTANLAPATALDITDNFPANMMIAAPANVVNTCTGGTLTATEGSANLNYTGGSVAASSSCQISVDVVVNIPGSYLNMTEDLTSSLGNSGNAGDTLTVSAMAPGFNKAFMPASVGVGASSSLVFTIDNSANMADASSLDFTDNLPAGLLVAMPANATNNCMGGTLTAVEGTSVISYTGGTVGALSSCTISVDTSANRTGSYANVSGDLTSIFGNSGNATDTLDVSASPLLFSKAFASETVDINTAVTLTFSIDNSANMADANSLAFTDNLPAGMTVANPANVTNNCAGGTLSANSGANSINYSGGAVAANGSCMIAVDVIVDALGVYDNTSSALSSNFGDSGVANDTITAVQPPGFTKLFTPDMVAVNEVSTLTFTIDNTANAVDAMTVDFVDNLPTGLIVATPPNANNSCSGGAVGATDGASVVSFTGGIVTAGVMCTISVDVIATTSGIFDNLSGELTSSLCNSGTAAATLTVASAPLFSKAFSPDSLLDNFITTLTFTIDNSGNGIEASDLNFVDNMPDGMIVAEEPNVTNNCNGGTLVADVGSGTISYTGGLVTAASVCTISVDVMVTGEGDFNNVAGPLGSSLGSSGAASASDNLMVMITRIIPSLSVIGLIVMTMLFMLVYYRRRKLEG